MLWLFKFNKFLGRECGVWTYSEIESIPTIFQINMKLLGYESNTETWKGYEEKLQREVYKSLIENKKYN